MKHSLSLIAFGRFDKNTLVGFCSIKIEEIKLTIHDIALHRKGAARWGQLPARSFVRDGEQVVGDDGKPKYLVTLEFEGRAVANAFSHAVWRIVFAEHPELAAEIAA
jgi:hypothetical protein